MLCMNIICGVLACFILNLNDQQVFSQVIELDEDFHQSEENIITTINSDNVKSLRQISDEKQDLKWKWKYVDEQEKSQLLIRPEESVDTRLANIRRVLASDIMIYPDIYDFGMDSKLDENSELTSAHAGGVDDELCGEQLKEILSLMEELQDITEERRRNSSSTRRTEERHLRLAIVLDSYGKYDAGIMAGRARFLGSHSQCVDSQLILGAGDATLTDMRYCMGKLRTDKHLDPALRALHKEPYQPDTVFSVAICVPKSCHTKSFRKHKNLFEQLVDSQFKLPKSIYIDENLELDSIFCLLDDSPLAKIPVSGYLFILFLVIWTSLTVYATFFKGHQNRYLTQRQLLILNSLDLGLSWMEFIGDKTRVCSRPSRSNLNVLSSIKVICSMLVVFGHTLFFHPYTTDNPLKAFSEFEKTHQTALSSSLTMIVDSFSVITGIIMARAAMRVIKSPAIGVNILNWFMKKSFELAAYRYLRLVPMYFLVFWFKKSIYIFLGSGPMWDYGYNNKTLFGSCRAESWFAPLTAQAAFKPIARQCFPQAWSIANDIFYSITLAPLIIFMTIRPRAAIFIATFLCLASNFSMFIGFTTVDMETKTGFKVLRYYSCSQVINNISFLYTSPYYRVFSVLIGTLAGYILHHYEKNEKLKEWPSWFKGFFTMISIFSLIATIIAPFLISLYGNLLPDPEDVSNLNLNLVIFVLTLARLNFALSSAILFLRMVTDWKDNFFVGKFTGQFWNTMVRLSYPILLVHIDIMYIFILMSGNSFSLFSSYRIWSLYGAVYISSCLVGTLLYVFIENPMDKLIRGILLNTKKAASEKEVKESLKHQKSS